MAVKSTDPNDEKVKFIDEDGFNLVTRKRNGNALVMHINRKSNIEAVTKRPFSIFVTRASTDSTREDIEYHVRQMLPSANIKCTPLKTRYHSYKSYQVDVITDNTDKLLDPDEWPQGILVRK